MTDTPHGNTRPFTLVLVARDALLMSSLKIALPLASQYRLRVVGTATDVGHGEELVREHRPDLAMIDLGLAGALTFISTSRALAEAVPTIGLLDPAANAVEALRAGCTAIVGPDTDPERLLAPILGAMSGWRTLSPATLASLLDRATGRRHPPGELDERTLSLWQHIAAGKTVDQIAETIGISPRSVKRLMVDLCGRLGATNRWQLAALAGRFGITDRSNDHQQPTS